MLPSPLPLCPPSAPAPGAACRSTPWAQAGLKDRSQKTEGAQMPCKFTIYVSVTN